MDPRWEPSTGGGARSRWASQPRRSLAGHGAIGRRQPERRVVGAVRRHEGCARHWATADGRPVKKDEYVVLGFKRDPTNVMFSMNLKY